MLAPTLPIASSQEGRSELKMDMHGDVYNDTQFLKKATF